LLASTPYQELCRHSTLAHRLEARWSPGMDLVSDLLALLGPLLHACWGYFWSTSPHFEQSVLLGGHEDTTPGLSGSFICCRNMCWDRS
jgi:hypothetical protein